MDISVDRPIIFQSLKSARTCYTQRRRSRLTDGNGGEDGKDGKGGSGEERQ